MRNALERSLPWQAAWIAPAVLVAALYAYAGDPTAAVGGGLLAGLVGIFGALSAELVRWHQERLDREGQLDEVLEILRTEKQYPLRAVPEYEVDDTRIDAMIEALNKAAAEKTRNDPDWLIGPGHQ